MSMDHRQAQTTKAAERYLLNEMSEPERFAFESHYFECDECAGEVRVGNALARGVRAVCAEDALLRPPAEDLPEKAPRAGWFAWFSPGSLVPSAAALAFAVLAGWEGLVVIPGLRSVAGSSAGAPIVLRAAARGEEQSLDVRGNRQSFVSLDVNSADPGTPLVYEVEAPGGRVRIRQTTQAPPAATPLIVSLPNSEIQQPGKWSLVLRNDQGTELGRYPFTVQLK